MSDPLKVPFEVVQLWYNDRYTPYTFSPTGKYSVEVYAIKIGNEYFLIGEKGGGGICVCGEGV